MSDQARPNPGSLEAHEAGCICAVLDNRRGAGYLGQAGVFVITRGCPVHAAGSEKQEEVER